MHLVNICRAFLLHMGAHGCDFSFLSILQSLSLYWRAFFGYPLMWFPPDFQDPCFKPAYAEHGKLAIRKMGHANIMLFDCSIFCNRKACEVGGGRWSDGKNGPYFFSFSTHHCANLLDLRLLFQTWATMLTFI